MEYIKEIIAYVSVIWVFTSMISDSKVVTKHPGLIKYLCLKCLTFWIVLIITRDIFLASTCSLTAYIFDLWRINRM